MNPIRIISIGYERAFLDASTEASARLDHMASSEFPSTMIVLSAGAEAKREYPHGSVAAFSGNAFVRMWKAYWFGAREVVRARKSGEFPIIIAQDPFAAGVIAFKLSRMKNVPFEIQEHGDFFSGTWERESAMNRLQGWLAGFLIKRADKIRAVSERVKYRLTKRFGIPEDRLYVRQVDQDIFWHLRREPRAWSEVPTIVAPCRFVKQKGLFVLLDAAATLRDCSVAFKLRLVGSGPLEHALRDRISALHLQDRVVIETWASQESIWGASDLFVLPSYYEGWGRTVVEAMAARVPIVATDTGCVGSLMRPQIDGRVVPVGDAKALENAITEQISEKDRREWMRDQAYARAKEYAAHQHEANEKQMSIWRSISENEIVDRMAQSAEGKVDTRYPIPDTRTAWKWTLLLMSSAVALRTLSVLLFWKSLGANREWGFFTMVTNWFMGYGYSYVSELGCASAYRSPGYLFILTGIYGLFGFANFLAQAIIQNIAAVLLVYVVYRIAVELFNDRRIGWIAGAIAMLHPYSFYHYTQFYHTPFSSLFIALFIYALIKLERTRRVSWAIWLGVLTAILGYVTGTILAAMPFMAGWLLWRWRGAWKQGFMLVSIVAIVSAGLIAPWTYRNWRVFHAFVPLTTDLGYARAKGYNDHVYYYNLLGYPQEAFGGGPIPGKLYKESHEILPEIQADMKAHGYVIPEGYFMGGEYPLDRHMRLTCKDQLEMDEVAFSKYWLDQSSIWLKDHYWTIGWKIQLQKVQEFWSPSLQPSKRYGAAWSFGNEGLLAELVKISLIAYVSFLEIAGAIGLWMAYRRKKGGYVLPFLMLFAVYTFMYSQFVGYTKYRIPLDGMIAIFSAIPVVWLWDRYGKKLIGK